MKRLFPYGFFLFVIPLCMLSCNLGNVKVVYDTTVTTETTVTTMRDSERIVNSEDYIADAYKVTGYDFAEFNDIFKAVHKFDKVAFFLKDDSRDPDTTRRWM